MSRVAALEQLTGETASPAAPAVRDAAATDSTAPATSFADVLAATTATAALPTASTAATGLLDPSALSQLLLAYAPLQQSQPATVPVAGDGSTGARVLAAAAGQVGVTEQPPGSNDGPALAVYRSAVEGSQPGQPWCADFASWAAAQAGVPLGDRGQGLGSVAQITDWASATGRLLPASATPAPGDLILFGDRHVGVVESVNPDGSLTTVEGNNANAVSRVQRSPSEATGYVQL